MKIYKIVNKEGLFSNGKSEPQFTKKGKTWKEIGHLKNHFHNAENSTYIGCDVME